VSNHQTIRVMGNACQSVVQCRFSCDEFDTRARPVLVLVYHNIVIHLTIMMPVAMAWCISHQVFLYCFEQE
jgi:hypothetical protein